MLTKESDLEPKNFRETNIYNDGYDDGYSDGLLNAKDPNSGMEANLKDLKHIKNHFTKQQLKIIKKYKSKAEQLDGKLDFDIVSNELVLIGIHYFIPGSHHVITDENCIASIDTQYDTRYHRPTFNVEVYNELLGSKQVDFKVVHKMQNLTLKTAIKLLKTSL